MPPAISSAKQLDLVGKGANAVVKETKKIADGTGKELQKLGKNAVKTTEMLAQKQHGYLKLNAATQSRRRSPSFSCSVSSHALACSSRRR